MELDDELPTTCVHCERELHLPPNGGEVYKVECECGVVLFVAVKGYINMSQEALLDALTVVDKQLMKTNVEMYMKAADAKERKA